MSSKAETSRSLSICSISYKNDSKMFLNTGFKISLTDFIFSSFDIVIAAENLTGKSYAFSESKTPLIILFR
jgi:hypothetical protein